MFRCDILEQFQSKTHILEQPKLLKFVTFCISARFGQFERLKIEVNGSERKWTTSLVDSPQSHQQQPLLFVQHWSCDSLTTSYNIDGNTQQLSKQSSRHTHVAPMHCSYAALALCGNCNLDRAHAYFEGTPSSFLKWLNPRDHEKLGLARNPDLRTFADICVLLQGICVLLRGWPHLKKSGKKNGMCILDWNLDGPELILRFQNEILGLQR